VHVSCQEKTGGRLVNKHNSTKKYLRKQGVADRYSVNPRTVDRWVADGILPPPIYLPGGRIPLFAEDGLDAHDRRATAERATAAA
jgi:predicted site-specific integrase-resolvase